VAENRSQPGQRRRQFVGQVERIAAVHQYGLRDRVRGRSKAEATYPARELLGFTVEDINQVRAKLVDHIAGSR
jgi:phage virion morphogenesis protein